MPTSPSSERELHLACFPRWLFRPTGLAAPSAATKHYRDSRLKPFTAQCKATMRRGSDPAERRTGTLLEGRFGSTVIRPSSKPTAVSLSANGTSSSIRLWQRWSRPRGDCPWWNYRYNALGAADPVIAPHPLFLALAEGGEPRRLRYQRLFADAIPEAGLTALRDATNGGFALGDVGGDASSARSP